MAKVRWGLGDLGTFTLTVDVCCWFIVCIVLVDDKRSDEDVNWLILAIIDVDDCSACLLLDDEDDEHEVDDEDKRRWLLLCPIIGVVDAVLEIY